MTNSCRTMETHARILGFSEVIDPRAYQERYFINAFKKFIFDLPALKSAMRATESDLEALGYDVDAYHAIESHQELSMIFHDEFDDSEMYYLSDGMYLAKDPRTGFLELR